MASRDLRGIEKIDALDVHRNVAVAKLGEHLIPIRMGAVQHCDVGELHRRPLLTHGRDRVSDERCFLLVVVVHHGLHRRGLRQGRILFQTRATQRLAWPAAIVQFNAGDLRIARNGLVGATQDRRRRAAVLGERDALHADRIERPEELVERSAGGAAETVDRLVGIADGKNVSLFSRQAAGQAESGRRWSPGTRRSE